MDLHSEAEQMLSSIPQCAKQSVFQAIADSGCGTDIKCLCTHTTFFAQLQDELPQVCSFDSIGGSFSSVSKLCLEAVPSLGDSRESTILGSVIALLTLATLAVILRFAARRISAAKFGIDDVLIMLSLVSAYGNDVIVFVALRFGYGKHAITLSAENLLKFAKCIWADQIFFACSVTMTKLSILFFYHRIFPSPTFTRISIFTGLFMICWLAAAIFAIIFSCVPVAYFWDKTIQNGGRCINQYAFTHSLTALNIITDVMVLVLPIPWMWNLQMKPARKFAVLGIFLLGSFVCVAAIVRIFFISTIKWSDAPYTFVDLGIWLNIECNMGIVSACLPILRPLPKHLASISKSIRSRHLSSIGKSSAHDSMSTARSERTDIGGGSRKAPERNERVENADDGSEMSSLELHTPKAGSLARAV